MAEEETKNCPQCGVPNPTSRVTCQVCHASLIVKKDPFSNQKPEPKKRGRKPKSKEKPAESIPPETKVKAKRKRSRRKKVGTSEVSLFQLVNGKLQAVKLNPFVFRPIKNKELSDESKSLLSVWNRNKDLFQK